MKTEYTDVTWRKLKIGDKVHGWRVGGKHIFAEATVKEVNTAYVILSKFDKYDERVDSETAVFQVDCSDDEYHAKYQDSAKAIVKALKNKIPDYEFGYHEMWNAWVDIDPYAMAKACKENNMKIIGVVYLSVPKYSLLGEIMEVGICCEYENGERFWCHTFRSTIEYITDKYAYLCDGADNDE